jgi:ATP-binding cassette, subfamily B, multidrug efflux pump
MFDKIKWLWSFYRKYLYVLAVLLFLTPVQTVFQITIPQLFGFSIDYLNSATVPDHFFARWVTDIGASLGLSVEGSFGLAFIVLGYVACVLYAFVQCHRAWMNCRLEWAFRQHAFDDITHKGPDFFNRFRTGDLVTRMTDDVAEKLSWFVCSGIFRLYEALLVITFVVMMMITIDPWLTLWTAGPLPILILIFFKSSSTLDRRYDQLQKRISTFNDVMEACFSGIRVVKAYVREKAQKDKYGQAARDRRQAEIDSVRVTTVVDSLYFYIWQFALVIVLVVGGYKVITSDMSVGNMATFIYYVVYLVFPMFDVGQFLVKSRQSAVSINRLLELEDAPPMVTDEGELGLDGGLRGTVEFEDATFGFPEIEKQIIRNIGLTVNAGDTIAVVGKVGAGKSWLVNLIPRLVDPTGGSVKLDGHDLRKYRLEDLRKSIGYVPQEPVLFSDTIRNNILMGRTDISEAVVDWAVDVAQLKSEFDALPKGLDTPIGTHGMMISGGQKQRLALARALVGKPTVLILDDCTSALDSSTEAALWDQLHEVMPDMSAILITHRPGTLEQVDRIYVIDDGLVSESGTHAELMNNGGHYASIYQRYRLAEKVGEAR